MARFWIAAVAAVAAMTPGTLAEAAGGGGGGADGLHLIEMDDFRLPIVDNDRLDGVLHLKLVLEAHDDAAWQHAEAQMPMLRAAAVSAGLEFARLHASNFRAVDVDMLAHDLDAALRAVDPGVDRVLIVRVAAMAS